MVGVFFRLPLMIAGFHERAFSSSTGCSTGPAYRRRARKRIFPADVTPD
ncbi:hypothetical protein GbCGDNIH7_5054 [Granulibacter bethesdensis]|nr:hypothetical protein GbCGDNIH7_5054 [Granulibacter bethesdensis]